MKSEECFHVWRLEPVLGKFGQTDELELRCVMCGISAVEFGGELFAFEIITAIFENKKDRDER
ncbi:MAG: hypothetical protein WCX74_01485 [Candidatus Paceibacterota bacterium]